MKPTTSRKPHASGRQPQPPDEPQRPPSFRPPPEARPRVHPYTTGAHKLHAISTDDTGPAARTRPRVPRQPLERSVIKASTRSRPATEPAVVEVLPRQIPLSTNARKLPTTRRAPTPREADHEAGAATERRAAQTSTHPAVQAKAEVTLSAKQSDLTTAASLQLVQRGTATSTVRADASRGRRKRHPPQQRRHARTTMGRLPQPLPRPTSRRRRLTQKRHQPRRRPDLQLPRSAHDRSRLTHRTKK
ncbi:salivary glue protein Sgs-3-like [Bactrocera dorsalis]|uniref:Salivary glue protein Sgs-3-like n=1 Tax=Bactrocera dorsalis TaxID=27457 RepID=A0ABM3K2Z8_BACDO|nr:salivary glue protein Sgs-3-like [Bactrocera dorsalis]